MRKSCLPLAINVVCLVCVGISQAESIIALNFNTSGGVARTDFGKASWSIYYGEDVWDDSESIFGNIFSTSDVGHMFTVTEADDPDFGTIVSFLTNGSNDLLRFRHRDFSIGGEYTGGYVSSRSESDIFKNVSFNGIDLQGYRIDSFSITINEFTLVSPGKNPNGDGNWTDFRIKTTFEINGVPEPATLLLLGLGAVILRTKVCC